MKTCKKKSTQQLAQKLPKTSFNVFINTLKPCVGDHPTLVNISCTTQHTVITITISLERSTRFKVTKTF